MLLRTAEPISSVPPEPEKIKVLIPITRPPMSTSGLPLLPRFDRTAGLDADHRSVGTNLPSDRIRCLTCPSMGTLGCYTDFEAELKLTIASRSVSNTTNTLTSSVVSSRVMTCGCTCATLSAPLLRSTMVSDSTNSANRRVSHDSTSPRLTTKEREPSDKRLFTKRVRADSRVSDNP